MKHGTHPADKGKHIMESTLSSESDSLCSVLNALIAMINFDSGRYHQKNNLNPPSLFVFFFTLKTKMFLSASKFYYTCIQRIPIRC